MCESWCCVAIKIKCKDFLEKIMGIIFLNFYFFWNFCLFQFNKLYFKVKSARRNCKLFFFLQKAWHVCVCNISLWKFYIERDLPICLSPSILLFTLECLTMIHAGSYTHTQFFLFTFTLKNWNFATCQCLLIIYGFA